MSYEIEYSDLNAAATKAKALKDCKDYLGTRKFNLIAKALKADNGRTSHLGLRMQLAIYCGIQGYPATALLEEFWSPQRDLFEDGFSGIRSKV